MHPQPHHGSGLIDRLMQPFHCGVVHRRFGSFVTDQFDAGHQPVATAHIPDNIIFFRQFKRALIQLSTPRRGVGFGIQAQGFRQAGHHGGRPHGMGRIGIAVKNRPLAGGVAFKYFGDLIAH